MAIARIESGQFAEIRPDLSLADVPAHKRGLWRDVPARPAVDHRIATVGGPYLADDEFVWTVTPRDLATIRDEFRSMVDAAAEAQRLLYITGGEGMAMTYAEKKEQALAVIELGADAANSLANNGAAEYPLLAASIGVDSATLYGAAEQVMARYEAWVAIGGEIERKRLLAKKAITDAVDAAAVLAAYESLSW